MKILIASPICQDAIRELSSQHDVVCAIGLTHDELCAAAQDSDILIFRSGVQINREVLTQAPNLQLIIRAGSGLDNLDLAFVEQRQIKLVRIPEPGAQAVAELAFGLMLSLARQIQYADGQLRQGHWVKKDVTGYLLKGKVLGIVGAGNIGTRVGQMGNAWGMRSIGCVESPKDGDRARLQSAGINLVTMEDLLRNSDVVSLHVPLQKSTRNLIDAAALRLMKPTSFLINMARGGVVVETDLLDALKSKNGPAGAGLDVHEIEGEGQVSPLANLPNVVLTPHIGAATVDTVREIGRRVIEIIETNTIGFQDNPCEPRMPVKLRGSKD